MVAAGGRGLPRLAMKKGDGSDFREWFGFLRRGGGMYRVAVLSFVRRAVGCSTSSSSPDVRTSKKGGGVVGRMYYLVGSESLFLFCFILYGVFFSAR